MKSQTKFPPPPEPPENELRREGPDLNSIALLVLAALCAAFLFCALPGCDNALRFAPSESQKQTAELTAGLARKVDSEGAAPASPASGKLVEGTRTAALYMGPPKVPPEPETFSTIAAQAQSDAVTRPDPWAVADHLLELGIGVSALLGGAYGVKAVGYLRQAREKSKALEQIIKGNEIFKTKAKEAKDQKAIAAFKQAQREAQTSTATKRLVTELRA